MDIEDVELTPVVKTLSDRILSSDPYIKQIRTGMFKANVLRIVIDLKSEVSPNVFALVPAGDYKHRLVVDIYPDKDPIMAMLEKRDNGKSGTEPSSKDQPKPVVEPLPAEPPQETSELSGIEPAPDTPVEPLPDSQPVEAGASPQESVAQAESQIKPELNKKKERVITIAIDAGHGGEDPGAKGASGTHEKEITRASGQEVKSQD